MLYDTHIHLDLLFEKLEIIKTDMHALSKKSIDEIDQFINTLNIKEVENISSEYLNDHDFVIQSTTSTNNFHICSKLFSNINKYHIMMGLHPEIINLDFDLKEYLEKQEKYLLNNTTKIIGIGEIGLDYYYNDSNKIKELQKKALISQIKLANRLDLPVIFHIRDDKDKFDAFDDFFEIIDSNPINKKFVIHCFTGNIDVIQKVVERNGFVGIGGIVTFNNAKYLQDAVEVCPLENIVLETDLPYLSPIPYRGKICMPEYVSEVAKKVSQIKCENFENIIDTTKSNAKLIFNL